MQEFLGANSPGPRMSMEERFEDRHLSAGVGRAVSNKIMFAAVLNSVFFLSCSELEYICMCVCFSVFSRSIISPKFL